MDAYVLAISVADSQNLPTRAKNVLKRLGCETIEDVVKLTPKQILRSKWAGKKVLAYIKLWLDNFGLSLSDSAMPTSTGFPLLNGYNLCSGSESTNTSATIQNSPRSSST